MLRSSPACPYFATISLQTLSALNNLSLQYPMCINRTLGSTRMSIISGITSLRGRRSKGKVKG